MTTLHLASNDGAGDVLRLAVTEDRLQGFVCNLSDALDAGPLHDGRSRAQFWQQIYAVAYPGGDCNASVEDAFAIWEEVRSSALQATSIVIWASDNAAEYVFLRMACRRLVGLGIPLLHVDVPPKQGCHAVAVHASKELPALLAHAQPLSLEDSATLAREFDRIAARPELVRLCDEHGRLRFADLDAYDHQLIAALGTRWCPGSHIVGIAMVSGDPRNNSGDALLAARLRHLVESGVAQEEYRAPPGTWHSWYVRKK